MRQSPPSPSSPTDHTSNNYLDTTMKITLELHASELNAEMLAALNTLLVEDKREELRAMGDLNNTHQGDPMAASELATRDPAALREETIAIAVAQDGADARVVGDWNPDAFSIFPTPTEVPANELAAIADPLAAGPTLAEMQESGVVDLSPINRADARLKVGDRVMLRGGGGPFTVKANEDEYRDPEFYPFHAGGEVYCNNGAFLTRGPHDSECDITTVNGRPIIDAEEA
jgi:hypothetical protein